MPLPSKGYVVYFLSFSRMLSFDTFPIAHTIPALLLCAGLLIWQFRWPERQQRWFLPAVLTLLLFLRLPSLFYNNEINPDESQMITQGRTLALDPVYFRSVDGTTIGPLDSYILIVPSWIGLPYTYTVARLVGFALLAFSLFFLYRTAKRWFGLVPARLALLPIVFTLGLTQNADLLSYCSELVPLCLLAMGTWLLAHIDLRQRPSYALIFLIGILIGLTPLGKLQGVPLAAVLGLFTVVTIAQQPVTPFAKVAQSALLGVGVLLFPILFIGTAWFNGLYADFWLFYIEGNLLYGGNTDHWQNILNFPRHLAKSDEFSWLVLFAGLLLSVSVAQYVSLVRRPLVSSIWHKRMGFLVLSALAGLYAVTRTGTEFVHYFYFLLGPLLLLLALGWKLMLTSLQKQNARLVPVLASLAVLLPFVGSASFLALFVGQRAMHYTQNIPLNPYPSNGSAAFATVQPPIVKAIRKYANEGEPLVIWGWRSDYYVGAQMQQGVAENHSERCVFQSAMTPHYQKRYFNDFIRSFPPVFVDAVGSQNAWFTDRATQGHEVIEPLAAFIRENYYYVGLANDARLYVRLDRINGKPIKQYSHVD